MKYRGSIFIFLVPLFFACGQQKAEEVIPENDSVSNELKLSKEQVQQLSIRLGNTEEQLISSTIKVQGMIDLPPQNIISVNFPLAGFLKQTKLIPGMQVRKGEIIATITDQAIVQMQQEFLMSKAKLDLLRLEMSRQQELKQANAGVSRNFQQTESEVKIQTITYNALREKLKMIGIDTERLDENNLSGEVQIKSPINGYVSKVNVNTGKYIQPTETLFELIDPDDIHVALTIFQKDLVSVTKGAKVMVYQPQDISRKFQAEVILVNKGIDDDRTAIAHCHFDQLPATLLPGMLVEAEVSIENKKASVLPEEAIVRFGKEQFVFVMTAQDVFEMIPVKTGITSDGKIEIIAGLDEVKPGSIVLNNAYRLLGMLKNSGEEE